ncbi:hypothetical protein MRB53_041393 [Persea americana]|nr:hypothetical protein MRB53_041393 [Persea americana]
MRAWRALASTRSLRQSSAWKVVAGGRLSNTSICLLRRQSAGRSVSSSSSDDSSGTACRIGIVGSPSASLVSTMRQGHDPYADTCSVGKDVLEKLPLYDTDADSAQAVLLLSTSLAAWLNDDSFLRSALCRLLGSEADGRPQPVIDALVAVVDRLPAQTQHAFLDPPPQAPGESKAISAVEDTGMQGLAYCISTQSQLITDDGHTAQPHQIRPDLSEQNDATLSVRFPDRRWGAARHYCNHSNGEYRLLQRPSTYALSRTALESRHARLTSST